MQLNLARRVTNSTLERAGSVFVGEVNLTLKEVANSGGDHGGHGPEVHRDRGVARRAVNGAVSVIDRIHYEDEVRKVEAAGEILAARILFGAE